MPIFEKNRSAREAIFGKMGPRARAEELATVRTGRCLGLNAEGHFVLASLFRFWVSQAIGNCAALRKSVLQVQKGSASNRAELSVADSRSWNLEDLSGRLRKWQDKSPPAREEDASGAGSASGAERWNKIETFLRKAEPSRPRQRP